MKHIKPISELFKSTYMSAAEKAYKYQQMKKGDELRKHGEYMGGNKPVERIFPHRFVFDHLNDYKYREYVTTTNKEIDIDGKSVNIEPPYFFITGYKVIRDGVVNNASGIIKYYVKIKIEFESNYGKKMSLDCELSIEDQYHITIKSKKCDCRMWITAGHMTGDYFKFKNRVDAVQFKKFLIEDFTPEFLEDIEEYPTNDCGQIDQQIGVIDVFEDYEDGKFHWLNGDGTPSMYIGFFKDISVNSMYRDPK